MFNIFTKKIDINKLYELLGKKENIKNIEYCFTRVRVEIKDIKLVNLDELNNIGIKNINIVDENLIHLIIGDKKIVEQVAEDLKEICNK